MIQRRGRQMTLLFRPKPLQTQNRQVQLFLRFDRGERTAPVFEALVGGQSSPVGETVEGFLGELWAAVMWSMRAEK